MKMEFNGYNEEEMIMGKRGFRNNEIFWDNDKRI
jgi:hypothetical protein